MGAFGTTKFAQSPPLMFAQCFFWTRRSLSFYSKNPVDFKTIRMEATAANYHVLSILETCCRLGIDRSELLHFSSISAESLLDPYARQPAEKVYRLWEKAEQTTNDPLIAFKVGLMASALHRSAVTSMIEACSSLGDALQLGLQYQHLTQNIVHSQLTEGEGFGYMRVQSNQPGSMRTRFQVERQLAFVLTEARNLSQDSELLFDDIELHFQYAPKCDPVYYQRLLKTPVQFHCEHNQLVFPKPCLELKNFSGSPQLISPLRKVVDQLDRNMNQSLKQNLKQQLHQLIEEVLSQTDVSLESIALKMHMSARTLQRRLKEENSSFSEVLDGVRRKRAFSLLKNQDTPVSEVAYQLGFTHITGFYSAFHRWTDMTPKEFQASLRSEPEKQL